MLNTSSTGMKEIQMQVSSERLSAKRGQEFPKLCSCGKVSPIEEKTELTVMLFPVAQIQIASW